MGREREREPIRTSRPRSPGRPHPNIGGPRDDRGDRGPWRGPPAMSRRGPGAPPPWLLKEERNLPRDAFVMLEDLFVKGVLPSGPDQLPLDASILSHLVPLGLDGVAAVEEFISLDLKRIRNPTGFFIGICKRIKNRQAPPPGRPDYLHMHPPAASAGPPGRGGPGRGMLAPLSTLPAAAQMRERDLGFSSERGEGHDRHLDYGRGRALAAAGPSSLPPPPPLLPLPHARDVYVPPPHPHRDLIHEGDHPMHRSPPKRPSRGSSPHQRGAHGGSPAHGSHYRYRSRSRSPARQEQPLASSIGDGRQPLVHPPHSSAGWERLGRQSSRHTADAPELRPSLPPPPLLPGPPALPGPPPGPPGVPEGGAAAARDDSGGGGRGKEAGGSKSSRKDGHDKGGRDKASGDRKDKDGGDKGSSKRGKDAVGSGSSSRRHGRDGELESSVGKRQHTSATSSPSDKGTGSGSKDGGDEGAARPKGEAAAAEAAAAPAGGMDALLAAVAESGEGRDDVIDDNEFDDVFDIHNLISENPR